MSNIDPNIPTILCFGGLDPTGGSGTSADIETLNSLGCHCAPVITAITARDTQSIKDTWDVESTMVIQQARAILEDMDIKAIKIGMLSSVQNIEAVHTILMDYPNIPVILDPVLETGLDSPDDLVHASRALLIPLTRIAVLNGVQIRRLAKEADNQNARAQVLIDMGCRHVFVSESPDFQRIICNTLFSANGVVKTYEWPLLNNRFVGAGSTLSAAITAYLTHQDSALEAISQGQIFTYETLKHGRRLGMGNWIPNRIFWSQR